MVDEIRIIDPVQLQYRLSGREIVCTKDDTKIREVAIAPIAIMPAMGYATRCPALMYLVHDTVVSGTQRAQ